MNITELAEQFLTALDTHDDQKILAAVEALEQALRPLEADQPEEEALNV